jgi:hypothetical protein
MSDEIQGNVDIIAGRSRELGHRGRPGPGRFAQIMASQRGNPVQPPGDAGSLATSDLGRQLLGVARELDRDEQALERAVRRARSGQLMSHEELLALQAGIHRHSQQVELASKLVDKTTGAIRQTLQSQN